MDVTTTIETVCREFADWLDVLPPWEEPPWVGASRGYRGPTLLGEADCRMHFVRLLARHVDANWLHQEVPLSAYLFPAATVSRRQRRQRIDIGLIDPRRLAPSLTSERMKAVKWNALIEVKFRGDSPGWEFATNSAAAILADVEKLRRLLRFCDTAHVVVIEEIAPLSRKDMASLAEAAQGVDLRFVHASRL